LLLVAGLSTASLSGALLKLMSSELNIAMMTAGRYTGYLLVLMPLALWRYGGQVFAPPQWSAQFARAVLILGATLTFVYAVMFLPLANAVSLLYIYPFLVAALSPWLAGRARRACCLVWRGRRLCRCADRDAAGPWRAECRYVGRTGDRGVLCAAHHADPQGCQRSTGTCFETRSWRLWRWP
jgi:hypothetical protein